MTVTTDPLNDLAARLASGTPFGRADAEIVWAAADLVRIGAMAEDARRHATGDDVTFGRVATLSSRSAAPRVGDAGEVRITVAPASLDDAIVLVRTAAAVAGAVPVTGFSLAHLAELAGHDHMRLAEAAHALRAAGLSAVAAAPLDQLGAADVASDVVRAVRHGGVQVSRLVVERATASERLDLVERAVALQHEVGDFAVFAPLPQVDPADAPSTGYDDVKSIAIARLWCRGTPRVQVDWPSYGPKLAQVALLYGANDIDGVASFDAEDRGPRRTALEEIRRQIRSAGAQPVERDGLFRVRA